MEKKYNTFEEYQKEKAEIKAGKRIEMWDFLQEFLGKQFYILRTGKHVDKWEVWITYWVGNITLRELHRNDSWIRHEDKTGWKDGQRIIPGCRESYTYCRETGKFVD